MRKTKKIIVASGVIATALSSAVTLVLAPRGAVMANPAWKSKPSTGTSHFQPGKSPEASLWTKALSTDTKMVLRRRIVKYVPPSLSLLKTLQKEKARYIPGAKLPQIKVPDRVYQYSLVRLQKGKPAKELWSKQQAEYDDGTPSELRVLDALEENGRTIVVIKPSRETLVELIKSGEENKGLWAPRRNVVTLESDRSGGGGMVQEARITGALKSHNLAVQLSWIDGATSLWAYQKGKWVQKRFYKPVDVNAIVAGRNRKEREDYKKLLRNLPPQAAAEQLAKFDRERVPQDPNVPEPTREETREQYRKSLKGMSPREIEVAMKQWEKETTSQKP